MDPAVASDAGRQPQPRGVELILANSRTPHMLEGDLHAQVATGELGARRLGNSAIRLAWMISKR